LLFKGCNLPTTPTVETFPATGIEPTKAISGGKITDDGNKQIDVRGVCWSTKRGPTTADPRTTDGYGDGSFTSTITGLAPSTIYYVRAYAINEKGTGYGDNMIFTTSQLTVATLTTAGVSGITQTTAVSGGNITFNGGDEITGRGVCWSTHSNPTIADSKTEDGAGTGTFSSNLTGLTGNTRYYVRAFATNLIGTAYGQEEFFTSGPVPASLITAEPSATGSTSGESGGNVISDGGLPVTARGVCWSTTLNPTLSNSKTADGSGTGVFVSTLTELVPNTRYHVRAYATNSLGTAYGADRTFYTDPVSIQDIDKNTYNVIRIGSQVWLKENLKTTHFNDGTPIQLVELFSEWSSLTTNGYCLYENHASNKDVYGAIYNWYAVETGKLCPAGWHVPSDDENLALEDFLLGRDVAGGKLKERETTHWIFPNTGASDEVGFTALPGGWRTESGTFDYLGLYGYWWTASEPSLYPNNAWFRRIQYDSETAFRSYWNEKTGMSIRCIKD